MTDWLTQYRAVRRSVGMIDRSKMGKIAISGEDRYAWLQGMVSQDVRRFQSGERSLPACILTPTGHVISDLTLIDITRNRPLILAVLPQHNSARVLQLLERFIITEDVELADVTASVRCRSYQGPQAARRFEEARSAGVLSGGKDEAQEGTSGVGMVAIAADHTGSGGYDLFFEPGAVSTADARRLLEIEGAPEIGTEAQEALRVEAGIPLFGAELNESVIALEANLGPTHVSLTKGCYVGQEIIARIDSRGHTNRSLTGLVSVAGRALQPGARLFTHLEEGAAREAGRITSAVPDSPTMNGRPIALAYVRHEFGEPGTRLYPEAADPAVAVEVVPLPFYRAVQA
jgi:folate-binding protein YgfZ